MLGFTPIPPPPHVFQLGAGELCYGQFNRERGGLRLRAWRRQLLPADSFGRGPLGGPVRDTGRLRELIGSLLGAIPGGAGDASLVVPDAWLRVTFAESGDLPPAGEALDEVLRWKLRRLVPFRVDELRIGVAEVPPLPAQEEPRRLLLGFGVEVLLDQLEQAFGANGIRLGQISNVSLSLLEAIEPPVTGDFMALALVDDDGYTLIFSRAGEPVLHRYKAFSGGLPDAALANLVDRDLKLTRNFLDEHFPGAALAQVLLVAPPALEGLWLDRLDQGLGEEAVALDGRHLPALRTGGESLPSWRDLAPLLGAAAREVE